MGKRHLFLQGGGPPIGARFGKVFAELTLRGNGKVAILLVEREGWQDYLSSYTEILKEYGVRDFFYMLLTPDLTTGEFEELRACTGIMIGGGETERYREYIVDTELGPLIKEQYKKGIPVAGFSAGALISLEHCVIPPIDNSKNEHLFLEGLGLLRDFVISVHYTFWEEEENLKVAISKTGVSIGYGIDDEAGLYFEDEKLTAIEGGNVYVFEHENGRWIGEKLSG